MRPAADVQRGSERCQALRGMSALPAGSAANIDEFPDAFDVPAPHFAPKPMAASETGYSTLNDGPSEARTREVSPALVLRAFSQRLAADFQLRICGRVEQARRPRGKLRNRSATTFHRSVPFMRWVGSSHCRRSRVRAPISRPRRCVQHLALERSDGTFPLLIWHDFALDRTSKKP